MAPTTPDHRAVPAKDDRKHAGVDSSTRVTVAFPFSNIHLGGENKELKALASMVVELAELVKGVVPGDRAAAIEEQARELLALMH